MNFTVKEISNDSREINNIKEFLYNQIKKEYGIGPNMKFHYDIEDLDDYYINCVGICQFLCILCRQVGMNITMSADEDNEHAICYFCFQDDKYGIDGYFSTDPTNDTRSEEKTNVIIHT